MKPDTSERSRSASCLITSPGLKSAVFLLEGLNSFSTTFFFYYLYFYTQAHFEFGTLQNLLLAALLGFCYAFGAFYSGRFAQRFGYFTAVQLGLATMAGAILVCSQTTSLSLTVGLVVAATVGMCFTWPALEALATDGEPPVRLQGLVGLYNFVWATTGALAYFIGGAIIHHWPKALFFVPAGMIVAELVLATWLRRSARHQHAPEPDQARPILHPLPETFAGPIPRQTFLKMGLLANPLAYLSINTLISTVPTLARRMRFTPEMAGFVCSVWLFARAAAFVALRLWPGWHYRFRFLVTAYVMMVLSFGAMLLAPNLAVLLGAQLLFGAGVGLIYYSSLFYSMDVGETKGEHGGIHEAAIGIGNTTGPATAAAALMFFPRHRWSGTCAVCLLLALGLAGLVWIRYKPDSTRLKANPPLPAISD